MCLESSKNRVDSLSDRSIPLTCFVFLILNRSAIGAEFLLQAHDDSEMNQWVGALQAQCQTGGGSTSGRSMTLPASSQKDETKRKSFFTLKKK